MTRALSDLDHADVDHIRVPQRGMDLKTDAVTLDFVVFDDEGKPRGSIDDRAHIEEGIGTERMRSAKVHLDFRYEPVNQTMTQKV